MLMFSQRFLFCWGESTCPARSIPSLTLAPMTVTSSVTSSSPSAVSVQPSPAGISRSAVERATKGTTISPSPCAPSILIWTLDEPFSISHTMPWCAEKPQKTTARRRTPPEKQYPVTRPVSSHSSRRSDGEGNRALPTPNSSESRVYHIVSRKPVDRAKSRKSPRCRRFLADSLPLNKYSV